MRDRTGREAEASQRGMNEWYRYNDLQFPAHIRERAMEAEHVNAIANAISGLKDRTAQLRRYL
jgi:hypothetical protein